MTSEQKAKDITKCLWFPQKCTEEDIQNMLMQMAEWKDKQFAKEKQAWIDKACKWLLVNDSYAIPTNVQVDRLREHLSNIK